MNFLWDLDGVLRDIHGAIDFEPFTWNQYPRHGLTLIECVNLNLDVLAEAKPTEFYPLARGKNITILTCQPINWIPYTKIWIDRYLPQSVIKYCQHPLEKLDYLTNGLLLIEDYPLFPDNSKIIMVDKPYNYEAKGCFARVKTPQELQELKEGL